ncbi:MAG: BON domain-containing protein [Azoarcus sp.]|jgi:osmotically-inducible protein OsmY|nr:BON domain-containing protein [Azoarcus sp.]
MNTRYTRFLTVRRTLLFSAFATACVPLLQGCFPLVAGGIVAGAVMVTDRRSSGAYLDDESIEWKTKNLIGKHFGSINHVNVTSYNRYVLLTGEVENENVRNEVQRLAGTVANVRAIINELVVGPPSSVGNRGNDGLITSNVKTRFLNNDKFSANHVKVITEANTVFLLGIVTREEGDQAAEVARTSQGVKKVVKVFEYINADEARDFDSRNAPTPGSPPEAP